MEIVRGDTASFKFQRISNKQPITTKATKIYFTVKNTHRDKDPIIQKTIDDMEFDENYFYHFTINPSDTDNLDYKDYVYDIEVKETNYTKTISIGTFKVCKEVTHANNEV